MPTLTTWFHAALPATFTQMRGSHKKDLSTGPSPSSAAPACDLETYLRFAAAVKVPLLANLTEFGATPLFTREVLSADVAMAPYPPSAFRAMNKAALEVHSTIRREGTQRNVVPVFATLES